MALESVVINSVAGDDHDVTFTYGNGKTTRHVINIPGTPAAAELIPHLKRYWAAWRRGVRGAQTPDATVTAILTQQQAVGANDPDVV